MKRLVAGLLVLASCVLVLAAADAGEGAQKKGGKRGGKKGGAGRGFGDPAQVFKKLDKNNDGKLTRGEILAIAEKGTDDAKKEKMKQFLGKAFDRMSKGSESVSLEQFTAARKNMSGGPGGRKGGKKGGDSKKAPPKADTE